MSNNSRRLISKFAMAILLLSELPGSAEELTGTLKKIKETHLITLGVRESSIPFSYVDDRQEHIGYAVDICSAIVEEMQQELGMPELKVQTMSVTSSTRIPLMMNGTIDLECGSTTNSAERQKQVAFSNTYYLATNKFVAKKTSNIKSIADLKGHTVVCTSGTTNVLELNDTNASRKLGLTILLAKDMAEAFLLVETGRAAAFVMDDVIVAGFVAASKDPQAYLISDEAFSPPQPYSVMMRRDDKPFKDFVDHVTADLYRSPAGKALYERWFLRPIPPRGLNLGIAMSPALERAIQNPTDSSDAKHYALTAVGDR